MAVGAVDHAGGEDEGLDASEHRPAWGLEAGAAAGDHELVGRRFVAIDREAEALALIRK